MKAFGLEGRGWRLEGEYLPAFSAAVAAAGLAPVTRIRREGGELPSAGVRVTLPEIHYDMFLAKERLAPGLWSALPPAGVPAENALARVAAPQHAELRIEVEGEDAQRLPVTLLPGWQWPHGRAARVAAASLVLPGDDAVSRTVVEAALGDGDGENPLSFLARHDPSRRVAAALGALYRRLAEGSEIAYEVPQVVSDTWSGATSQKVRKPEDIFLDAGRGTARGNCLDLTLFLAGCLESLGLAPLVLFAGDPEGSPSHAFLGAWRKASHRFRPLVTRTSDLAAWVARGELLVLESTGVCRGEMHMDFETACAHAAGRVTRGEPVHALDIGACRPPHGSVRPLSAANSAVVQRAIWSAEEFVRRRGVPRLESTDLLFGLCAARGEVTTWLLGGTGSDCARVQETIERSRERGEHALPPAPTRNTELCLEAARANARGAARLVVEEVDLLWAVLENQSANIERVLAAAGCALPALKMRLEARAHRSYDESVYRDPAGPGAGQGDLR